MDENLISNRFLTLVTVLVPSSADLNLCYIVAELQTWTRVRHEGASGRCRFVKVSLIVTMNTTHPVKKTKLSSDSSVNYKQEAMVLSLNDGATLEATLEP